tara:strand:- start:1804 stop:2391 length:588 start_codon:yes stop_codon:yes gene_type:complete
MADTILSNAFISLNDVINNFLISYTGPGKLIPDSKRTEVIFHARRCLQEFAYETLKSQFTAELATLPATFTLPADFVSTVSVVVNGVTFTQTEYTGAGQSNNEFAINYTTKVMHFSATNQGQANFILKYLSNALTTDENAAIPKLAEEALYACIVYAILANRENTNPNVLQRLLIEKIDKLERSKSRLIFTNFSE